MSSVFYISGPMTGYDNFNYQYFEFVATQLREVGYEVISPHEIPAPPDEVKGEQAVWEWYIERCIEQMASCTEIIMLKGFAYSRGALRELEEATRRGFPIYFFDDTDPDDWMLVELGGRPDHEAEARVDEPT